MKRIAAFVMAGVLMLAYACGPRVNDPADVQAITQLMEGYFKSASAKDPAALQAVLSDQTILFEPNMAPLAGKDAIGKMHESFMGQFGIDAKGPVAGVRVAGDLAVAYGKYAETITPKDETLAAEKASGHWMAVLQRQAGGAWKWEWVMANSDQPMPGMTADGAEERALLDIERGFTAAALNRDMAFFERHVAGEYVQIVDGKPVDFRAQLAAIKSGQLRIDSAKLRDMQVRVFGDAAIVSLAGEATGTYKGKPFADGSRGIDFFAKRDGRWQVVYSQMTSIKE
jgi:uncharacterized protein (TIGR02246 family)